MDLVFAKDIGQPTSRLKWWILGYIHIHWAALTKGNTGNLREIFQLPIGLDFLESLCWGTQYPSLKAQCICILSHFPHARA